MKKISRVVVFLLVAVFAIGMFAGCAQSSPEGIAKEYASAINGKNQKNLDKLFLEGKSDMSVDMFHGMYSMLGEVKSVKAKSIKAGKVEKTTTSTVKGVTEHCSLSFELEVTYKTSEGNKTSTDSYSYTCYKKGSSWYLG